MRGEARREDERNEGLRRTHQRVAHSESRRPIIASTNHASVCPSSTLTRVQVPGDEMSARPRSPHTRSFRGFFLVRVDLFLLRL